MCRVHQRVRVRVCANSAGTSGASFRAEVASLRMTTPSASAPVDHDGAGLAQPVCTRQSLQPTG